MKAILIDPFAQTITEVEYTGVYTNIYEHIGADCFTTVNLGDTGDCIYVDDEGLFRDGQRYFMLGGYPQPLAGKGLVLGTDEAGESVEPKLTRNDMKRLIDWVKPNLKFAHMETREGKGELMGEPAFIIQHTPAFKLVSYKPMVSTDGGQTFTANGLRFATKDEAEASAMALMMRWMLVTDWKAEESDDPVNYRRHEGRDVPIIPAP